MKILTIIKVFLLSFLFLVGEKVYSQIERNMMSETKCGNTYNKLLSNKILNTSDLSIKNLQNTIDSTTVYRIPITFNIVHLGEAMGTGSNITDGQVQAMLEEINTAYRARGTFKNYYNAVDTKIEFVLANCKGIYRANGSSVQDYPQKGIDYLNNTQHNHLKLLFSNYSTNTLNVFIGHKVTNAAGFAYYGEDVFVGSSAFPTNNPVNSSSIFLLTHEIGHALFLEHTFEGNGPNNDCPVNNNPAIDGDGVEDTPPHKYGSFYFKKTTDINPCTNQEYGSNIIFNWMNSSSIGTNFSKGQILKMRRHIINDLSHWINSSAVITPNNQIVINSITPICAGGEFSVNYTNSSGAVNPALIIRDKDGVVFYKDLQNGSNIITLPKYALSNNFAVAVPWIIEDNQIKIVAGCNTSNIIEREIPNTSFYSSPTVIDSSRAPDYGGLVLCPNSSLKLQPKIIFRKGGISNFVTINVDNLEERNIDIQWKKNGNNLPLETNKYLTINTEGNYSFSLSIRGCPSSEILTPEFSAIVGMNKNLTNSTVSEVEAPLSQCTGATIKLYSYYTSNNATYQWFKDGNLINGANKNTYNVTSSGIYKVLANDTNCTTNSNQSLEKIITISNVLENKIRYDSNSDSVICGDKVNILYSIYRANNTTYQWFLNGVQIPDKNSSSILPSEQGIYSLRVTQNTCSSLSNGYFFTKSNKHQKPNIIPESNNFPSGTSIYLKVDKTNYQTIEWFKNNVSVGFGNTLLINSSGEYKVKKGSGDCQIESDVKNISFSNSFLPKIITNDSTIYCGYGVQLKFDKSILASETGFTYRWVFNGVDVPLSDYSANKDIYYATGAGTYRLKVIYNSITYLSNEIPLSRKDIITSNIICDSKYACASNSITLIAPQRTPYSTNIVWKKNGVILEAFNGFPLIPVNQGGVYTCEIQAFGCAINTYPFDAKFFNNQTINIGGGGAIRAGQSADILLNKNNPLLTFIHLSDNTEYYLNSNSTRISKSPMQTTVYSIVKAGNECGEVNSEGFARIDFSKCLSNQLNESTKSGDWINSNIWSCGSTPTIIDNVKIKAPHKVILYPNNTGKYKNITTELGSVLEIFNGSILKNN